MRFPEFKEKWKIQSINNLLLFQNGINADASKYGRGVKYISVGDILKNSYINYENIKGLVDINEAMLNNYSVTYGDILFQRSSEVPEDIGKTNVYLDKNKSATFGGFVIRGKKIGIYVPLFFHYLLKNPLARKSIIRLGAGAQHYNIGQENLRSLNFYFPELLEQEKIADLLFKIDNRIVTQIKIIEDYSTLNKGLNQKLIGSKHRLTRLAECLVCNSSNLKESDILTEQKGKFPVYGANGYITSINEYQIEKPSIAIIKDGTGVGRMSLLKGKYSVLGTINYLTCSDKHDIDYLYYALQNINFKPYIVGSGIPHIYFKDYKNEKIFYSNNNYEIKNIVNTLSSIDLLITIEKNKLSLLMKEKEYLLNNLFV